MCDLAVPGSPVWSQTIKGWGAVLAMGLSQAPWIGLSQAGESFISSVVGYLCLGWWVESGDKLTIPGGGSLGSQIDEERS